MKNKLSMTFPCWVITVPPFRFSERGEPISEETTFHTNPSKDGTSFLLLFQDVKKVNQFVFDMGGCGTCLVMKVIDSQKLRRLLSIIEVKQKTPVGLLVDPDSMLRGYPIAPDDAAKLGASDPET